MTISNKLHLAGETYLVCLESRIAGDGFCDEACYKFYLLRLFHCLNLFQVKLHAYLLLPREVSLLVTPGSPFCLRNLMRTINRSYSEYFNTRFGRAVKVWSDTPRSSLVQEATLALQCQKYIERRPLAESELGHPGIYRWSSYCTNAFGGGFHYLKPLAAYKAFIIETTNPYKAYREYIATPFKQEFLLYLQRRIESGAPITKTGRRSRRKTSKYRRAARLAQFSSTTPLCRQG